MSKQEIMFQHVENWKRSGLTQATYCEGQNLKTPTFSYWVIKYQKQNTHLDSESAFITIEKQASLSCGNNMYLLGCLLNNVLLFFCLWSAVHFL